MRKSMLAVIAGGSIVLATALAGCSSDNDSTGPDKSTAPSASAAAALPTNTCTDGQLTVTDAAKAKKALAKGCASVALLLDGAEVTVGPLETLSVEGSNNKVTGSTMQRVSAMGTGNAVSYTGEAPDTEYLGEGNTAAAVQG